jgi:L-threonylcarbamoyladenylate synthase
MKARILSPTLENLQLAAQAIRNGEVIGMPTETVYGLAGDAMSPLALARIFDTKERPTFDPLIIHVGPLGKGVAALERLKLIDAKLLSPACRGKADQLMLKFWPGPLTLVLPKHPDVPDLATSGLPSVALRMPNHPVAQALIAFAQTPLAAPSANRFGRISPTTAQAVAEELGDRIDWILDGGASQIGVESTVISLTSIGAPDAPRDSWRDEIRLLRPGGTPREEIEKLLGHTILLGEGDRDDTGSAHRGEGKSAAPLAVAAPGMLESHYAPEKALHLLPNKVANLVTQDFATLRSHLSGAPPDAPVGLLLISGGAESLGSQFSSHLGRPVVCRSLCTNGDLAEAARHLFAEMRWLDTSAAVVLFVEPCDSKQGLGYAITDRLRRASHKRNG